MLNQKLSFTKFWNALWETEPYRSRLTIYAKNTYCILARRYNYSSQNPNPKFLHNGRLYIVYPVDELANYMRIDKKTVSKAIKELETIDLIECIRKAKSATKIFLKEIIIKNKETNLVEISPKSMGKTDANLGEKRVGNKINIDKEYGGINPPDFIPHESESDDFVW